MRWQLEASTDGKIFLTLFSAPNPTHLGNEVQQFEVDTVHKYNCYRVLLLNTIVFRSRTLKPWVVLHAIIHVFRLVEYYNCNTELTPITRFKNKMCYSRNNG